LILGLAAFRVVVSLIADKKSFLLALLAFCILGVGILTVGVLSARWLDKVPLLSRLTDSIPQLIKSLPDLSSSGVHPNQLAGALILYLPLSLALLGLAILTRKQSVFSWVLLLGSVSFAGIVSVVLLLTQSRSGWIGGIASTVILVTLWGITDSRDWMRTLGVSFFLLTVVAVAIFVLSVGPQKIMTVLYNVGSQTSMESVIGEMTLAGRVEIWSRAIYAIQDFAFTGCGLGTFREIVHILYPLFLIGPDYDIAHAHNIFLQTGLDLGLPGLVAYLAMLLIAIAICGKHIKQDDLLRRSTALGLVSGLIGLHIYGLTDALALGSKPGLAFWLALGLIAGLERLPNQTKDFQLLQASWGSRVHTWLEDHRQTLIWVAALTVIVFGILGYWGWFSLKERASDPIQKEFRVPIYEGADKFQIRQEEPPPESNWLGQLEVATFTTTHTITNVVNFYDKILPAQDWVSEMEAGDQGSWGGIYTKDDGYAVCLLNVFTIEQEVRASIVCGDKQEPVDLPVLSPLPTPTATKP
jgi:putative inorganic carbon (HCO3(-)) transporter